MNKKSGIYKKLLYITIFPIIILGISTTIISVTLFTKLIYNDCKTELKNIAFSVLNTYDLMYPGDYCIEEKGDKIIVKKGDNILTSDTQYVDSIKEDTGIDITLFYYNTRVVTTLKENGQRIIGTYASKIVEKNVLEENKEHFYNNVMVGKKEYMAYYRPIYNSDNKCVGMIFAGKAINNVKKDIKTQIFIIICSIIAITLLIAVFVLRYAKSVAKIIEEIQKVMGHIAKGELSNSFSDKIINRNDEFALIAKSAQSMQNSLSKIVEFDVLTQVYNRMFGEKKLEKTIEKVNRTGEKYCISIGDIDFFKKVNDTYGHDCGDLVLKKVASILKEKMLGNGFVIRWGGEEFLLIFENKDLEQAYDIISKILNEIRETGINYNDKLIKVTMTFGVVEGNENDKQNMLIKKADDKLYFGKENGRNRIIK